MDDDERFREHAERSHDPARVLALSDGVFAIILTLLVLELHVPELTGGANLRGALREVRPSFIAFVISFVVVAIAWAGHRDLFTLIRRTDRKLVWLNLLYLFPLSILPFGASLLARYDREPVALHLYGILLIAISVTRLTIWFYATRHPYLLFTAIDARSRQMGILVVIVPTVAYLIAIAIAERTPTLSLAIYAFAPLAYFASVTFARSSSDMEAADQDFT